MKKTVLLLLLVFVVMGIGACGKVEKELVENPGINQETSTISGSFTVYVQDVLPDYIVDDFSPNVAYVTEFQHESFAFYVGSEIGSQLEKGKAYVFTIEPVGVNCSKDFLESLDLSQLVSLVPHSAIKDFRLATEDEIGLESLRLTVE